MTMDLTWHVKILYWFIWPSRTEIFSEKGYKLFGLCKLLFFSKKKFLQHEQTCTTAYCTEPSLDRATTQMKQSIITSKRPENQPTSVIERAYISNKHEIQRKETPSMVTEPETQQTAAPELPKSESLDPWWLESEPFNLWVQMQMRHLMLQGITWRPAPLVLLLLAKKIKLNGIASKIPNETRHTLINNRRRRRLQKILSFSPSQATK